jgi:excisionase family DNA binding protein
VSVLVPPLVVIGERDAAWVAEMLDMVIRSGYFQRMPNLGERAVSLVSECRYVATSGQAAAELSPAGDNRLMTYAQAARVLNVSTRTVRRRVAEGTLPVVRIGALVRFRPADLLREVS